MLKTLLRIAVDSAVGDKPPVTIPLPEQIEDPLRSLMQLAFRQLPKDWPSGLKTLALFAALWGLAIVLGMVLQFVLLQLRRYLIKPYAPAWFGILLDAKVLRRAASVFSPLIIQMGMTSAPSYFKGTFWIVARSFIAAYMVLCVVRVLLALLDAIMVQGTAESDTLSHRRQLSMKSYVQLAKLLVVLGGIVVMVAELINRSPLLLLSGLGALSAILILVFRDTILSFAAGVQLASTDMLRVGDWIEVAQVGADGHVVDMALHTVTVRNWDRTITTIPTWRLVNESYRNWRGMIEAGGRRIQRSLPIDATSVRFLQEEELQRLNHVLLLRDYLRTKREELDASNAALQQRMVPEIAEHPINQRRLTNLGTFRAYVILYLAQHPELRHDMLEFVSIMNPTTEGVPLQISCFAAATNKVEYERIFGDIFDHLMAVLPEFGLRIFQQPSTHDMRHLFSANQAAAQTHLHSKDA
ncbi:MAG: mechanosensitive ion channel family protein [Brachymonas sp.]|nr:mechanosensitive ion channel family protein [Brachymonas sp.]